MGFLFPGPLVTPGSGWVAAAFGREAWPNAAATSTGPRRAQTLRPRYPAQSRPGGVRGVFRPLGLRRHSRKSKKGEDRRAGGARPRGLSGRIDGIRNGKSWFEHDPAQIHDLGRPVLPWQREGFDGDPGIGEAGGLPRQAFKAVENAGDGQGSRSVGRIVVHREPEPGKKHRPVHAPAGRGLLGGEHDPARRQVQGGSGESLENPPKSCLVPLRGDVFPPFPPWPKGPAGRRGSDNPCSRENPCLTHPS